MANKPQHDETAIDADATRRMAAVIAQLIRDGKLSELAALVAYAIRDGMLRWSSHAGTPVTGRPDQLTDQVEEWLRSG